MNKAIKIKHFDLIDYNTLMKVVSKYIELHQISRDKLEYEKDFFDLTDTVYSLEVFKHAKEISIENHWKYFWVSVKESRTQYTFEIWYNR